WTCMPFDAPLASVPCISALTGNECVFCGISEIDSTHHKTCAHRVADCLDRPLKERVYSRKDHFIQHIKQFHHANADEKFEYMWSSDLNCNEREWKCGFCGEKLMGWDTRATHIAMHFRQGLGMSSWD